MIILPFPESPRMGAFFLAELIQRACLTQIDADCTPPIPPLGDCVIMANKGGEAVRFQSLECGSFRLWGTVACTKNNVFIGLARRDPNGQRLPL
jgi:hypothetical protein